MTCKECYKIIKEGAKEFQDFRREFYKNRNAAKDTWKETIEYMKSARPGIDIVIHHYLEDDPKYETWYHVFPMYRDDHTHLHHINKPHSEAARKKMSESSKGKLHSEETKRKIAESGKKARERKKNEF